VRHTEHRLPGDEITRLLFTDGIGDMSRHLKGAATPRSGSL
jgi:hypothetical protein